MKVALLMGNRLNPWHTRLFEPLAGVGVDVTALTYPPHRYPLELVRIPYRILPTRAQQRSLSERLVEGLSARVHGTTVDETPLGLAEALEEFDLIQSWELFSYETEVALRVRREKGTPVLVTVWDNIPCHHEWQEPYSSRKQAARREADGFITCTEESACMLKVEGVSSDRIFKISPAVDPQEFNPAPAVFNSVEGEKSEHRCSPVILGIGRMVTEKGFQDLVSAAILLHREQPEVNFCLHLVGEGTEGEILDRMAQWGGLGDCYQRTMSMGYDALPELYRNANLLVLPSRPSVDWKEQFGMVLLEAMASGVATIGSDSGGIPEIIGDAGLLFPAGNFVALANAIQQVLTDHKLNTRLIKAGLARTTSHFDRKQNALALAGIYRQILGQ